MAECTGLENRRRVKPTVGSNPTLSASKLTLTSVSFFMRGGRPDGMWGVRRPASRMALYCGWASRHWLLRLGAETGCRRVGVARWGGGDPGVAIGGVSIRRT